MLEYLHAPQITITPGLNLAVVASLKRVQATLPGTLVSTSPMEFATDDEIELVVIASPNDTHPPLTQAVLEARKHVVVDEPFIATLAVETIGTRWPGRASQHLGSLIIAY